MKRGTDATYGWLMSANSFLNVPIFEIASQRLKRNRLRHKPAVMHLRRYV